MLILRALLVLVFVFVGYLVGLKLGMPQSGIIGGLALGVIANLLERLGSKVKSGTLVSGLTGLSMGLLATWLLLMPLGDIAGKYEGLIFLGLGSLLGYGGLLIGLTRGRDMSIVGLARSFKGKGNEGSSNIKILDTSVIIDGRIADISETGFLEGDFLVPQFILLELQHIADSADSLKRSRGRRGLDILNRMQKMHQINVKIVDNDFPKIREVDSKLVALGKQLDAKLVTNDFNLNKVAELQGVTVLNINELANAIKPLVLPGEPLKVFVIKGGKENNQGVAYMEDGTMVVVDNGKKMIGKNIDVTVTSVLQTTAGRMIFTKTREEAALAERAQVKN